MAEAALKYDEFDDFDDIEPIEIPAGGIATFLTAKEGMFADDDDDIPTGGIASVKQVADQLAEYGRHEDEFMVHAAEGETVIPMEVFRKNPILKENIYRQMRDMGLEPERYVIGNELNSINPVTGQPEFFIKKLFKKLGKFLKKAIKVILPIALNFVFPGLGTIASAAIGSGIGGLIQGESFGQALKSAAIGGLTAGAAKGISGGIGSVKAGGKFGTGFKAGIKAPAGTSAFQAGKASIADGVVQPNYSELTGEAFKAAQPPTPPVTDALQTSQNVTGRVVTQPDQYNVQAINEKAFVDSVQGPPSPTAARSVSDIAKDFRADAAAYDAGRLPPAPGSVDAGGVSGGIDTGDISVSDKISETVGGPGPATTAGDALQRITGTGEYKGYRDILGGLKDLYLPPSFRTDDQILRILKEKGIDATSEFGKAQMKSLATRGIFQRFAPAAITAMGIGNIMNPTENPESVDFGGLGINEAMALLEANPEKYDPFGGAQLTPRGAGGFNAYEIQSTYNQPLGTQTFQSQPTGNVASDVFATVANGGGMNVNDFPPRVGAIAGPGTETSDDIPAMLSDGEFVMTAEAVRGAGNGNRQNGMRNMYQMMNQFEAMA
tara:strand:- start:450 stop:2270 length:1821 start_codon:yes stop_codon:yes gene_type:complete